MGKYVKKELTRHFLTKVFSVLDFSTPEKRFRTCFVIALYNSMVVKVNNKLENIKKEGKSTCCLYLLKYPLDSNIEKCVKTAEMDDLLEYFDSDVSIRIATTIMNDNSMWSIMRYCKSLINNCNEIGDNFSLSDICTFFNVD